MVVLPVEWKSVEGSSLLNSSLSTFQQQETPKRDSFSSLSRAMRRMASGDGDRRGQQAAVSTPGAACGLKLGRERRQGKESLFGASVWTLLQY